MNIRRFTLAALLTALAARPARAQEAAPSATTPTAPAAVAVVQPERPEIALHKVAFGVRVGQRQFALGAQNLQSKGVPVDNWSERATLVVPTFCVGGDGYFMKLDFPVAKMPLAAATSYGLGLYPLNYGHLFQRTGLFPFASAGIAASIMTLPGQGISGASAEARLAAGAKVRLWSGVAFSAEVGYAPYMAAGLVDKKKMHDVVQGAIDGNSIDSPPGTRAARGGVGHGLDLLVGVEWL